MKPLGKWCVVDEESMSTEPNAAIMAIGATMIDDLTPVDRFYVNVDLQSCLNVGLHESQSTRDWWAKQPAEAYNAMLVNPVPIQTALQMWSDWIKSHGGRKVRLMGNGPCADNMWLNSAYNACGMTNPVPFWNDIDHRTLNWIGGRWFGLDKKDIPFKGTKHHAGDDAEHEALHAIEVLKKLKPATEGNMMKFELNINADEGIISAINNLADAIRGVSGVPVVGESSVQPMAAAEVMESLQPETPVAEPEQTAPEPESPVTEPEPSTQEPEQQFHWVAQTEKGIAPAHDQIPQGATYVTPEYYATVLLPELSAPEPEPSGEVTQTGYYDDWGLEWDEKWNAGGYGKTAAGAFKRKPKTNEEQYALWMQERVSAAQASGTFAGPENWATQIRVAKYLKPAGTVAESTPPTGATQDPAVPQTTAQPVAPHVEPVQQQPAQNVQQQPAQNVQQQPAQNVQQATGAPTAQVGTAQQAAQLTAADMQNAMVGLAQTFGAMHPVVGRTLAQFGVQNVLQLTPESMPAFQALADDLTVNRPNITDDPQDPTAAAVFARHVA